MTADADTAGLDKPRDHRGRFVAKGHPPKRRRAWKPSDDDRLVCLDDLDKRSKAYQRAEEHRAALISDLGGSPDRLTAGQLELVQYASVLRAIRVDAEVRWLRDGTIDLSAYLAVGKELRQVSMMLGLSEREMKPVNGAPPTLEGLAQRFRGEAA